MEGVKRRLLRQVVCSNCHEAKCMSVKDKVCRNCKRFVGGSVCPVCNQANFSRSWKGVVVINDPKESEIAQAMGITVPGKYCLWTK